MLKDAMGSELKEGCLVRVRLDEPAVIGKIIKIAQGGLINPRDPKGLAMPTRMLIVAELIAEYMDGTAISTMLRLYYKDEPSTVYKLEGSEIQKTDS